MNKIDFIVFIIIMFATAIVTLAIISHLINSSHIVKNSTEVLTNDSKKREVWFP